MTTEAKNKLRVVRTDPFRMSFFVVPPMKAKTDDRTGRQTFGGLMLFPPTVKMDRYHAALEYAMIEKFGPDKKNWPRIKRRPEHVITDFEAYNKNEAKTELPGDWCGWHKISCSTRAAYPPGVVGSTKNAEGKFAPITDPREIYGGRWARAEIEAYHYDNDGQGVTFGLRNVQLGKHDTPFGRTNTRPEDVFADEMPEEYRDTGDAFEAGGAPSIVPPQSPRQTASNGW